MRIVALQLAAVAVGVSLAFAAGNAATTKQASATSHCTRYAPFSLPIDHNCGTGATMAANGQWQTNGIAYRDTDAISLSSSRCWSLWYSNTGKSSGCGTSGIIGSTPGQTYALCSFSGSDVFGYCNTFWH
jgi:hypothetical protein